MQQRPARATAALVLVTLAAAGAADAAALRVMDWNVGNQPRTAVQVAQLSTVVGYAGGLNLGDGARPVDLLALAETDATSSANVLGAVNTLYGGRYASIVTGNDGGGDSTGFVYNTDALTLVGSRVITGGLTHFSQVGTFSLNADPSQRVTAYAVHLKSGTASADRNRRTDEAALLRADADALGTAALGNLIYLGDFNWQRSSEGAWGNLTAGGGAGRGFDPIDSPGDWHDNAAFLGIHTQDPSSQMDDRFDVQLMGGTLFDGLGLDYAAGSYRAVGNNGTHLLNTAITTGSGAPADVLSSLAGFDHLPVVSELNLVAVPEPGTLLVLAAGGAGLLLRRRGVASPYGGPLHRAARGEHPGGRRGDRAETRRRGRGAARRGATLQRRPDTGRAGGAEPGRADAGVAAVGTRAAVGE